MELSPGMHRYLRRNFTRVKPADYQWLFDLAKDTATAKLPEALWHMKEQLPQWCAAVDLLLIHHVRVRSGEPMGMEAFRAVDRLYGQFWTFVE